MTCGELLYAADILLKLAQLPQEKYIILRADRQLVELVISQNELPYTTIGWDSVGKQTLVERK